MHRIGIGVVIIIAVFLLAQHPVAAEARFQGSLALEPLPDGRNMTLLSSIKFIDAKGRVWHVPAGTKTDGASVPRIFWQFFPPFTGKYRSAAVVHDHYCRIKTYSWQDTHNMFYEAMLVAGEAEATAKVMWAAVYNFGPRWGANVRPRAAATEEEQKAFVDDLTAWIAKRNPTREDIAKAIDLGRVPKF